jgi:hypothetical protein
MFFYRESVDLDYPMEIQGQSGITLNVNSHGGEDPAAFPGLPLPLRMSDPTV